MKRVLIYGGKGALGSKCVSAFKAKNYWVGSVDLAINEEADVNISIKADDPWTSQSKDVLSGVESALSGEKLDGIFCVAGGWGGGNAASNIVQTADLMCKQSIWSSVIAAHIAAKFLKEGGFLQLTGAQPALSATSGMIGYGMAKAAVHHLTQSLAADGGGLPKSSSVVAILPITLDTPMNRKFMPKADHSKWTPLEFVADLFDKWLNGADRPPNGGLVQLVTNDGKTELVI